MKNGKLPPEFLKELLSDTELGKDVIEGPKIGLDAAKIRTSGKNLIIGGDPITFRCEQCGKLCVYINANDITVSGGLPKFFMTAILLPTGTDEITAKKIFRDIKSACRELNISLIGGHTEITDCVTRPVVSGTMFGEEIYKLNPSETPQGADIILINRPAIEGCGIICQEGIDFLVKHGISEEECRNTAKKLNDKGICIFNAGQELFNFKNIYYMHDPTEGGISSALWEMSYAINRSIEINEIEFMEETEKYCNIFGLDKWGLISSGSLLAVAENGNAIAEYMTEKNYYAKVIGKVTDGSPNVIYKNRPLKTFQRDEIVRFYEKLSEDS